jgi:hypothetical protein
MQQPGGGSMLKVSTGHNPASMGVGAAAAAAAASAAGGLPGSAAAAAAAGGTHYGLKQTLNDISNAQRKMQRKMIEADKNLRGLFRSMFEQHAAAGGAKKFTVELEQPLRSMLLQIKRDLLRTVKEERVILREFSISEGLPASEIPEVLTRGVDVDSPNWRQKLQNPKFQSSVASVKSASLKTQALLDTTAQELRRQGRVRHAAVHGGVPGEGDPGARRQGVCGCVGVRA